MKRIVAREREISGVETDDDSNSSRVRVVGGEGSRLRVETLRCGGVVKKSLCLVLDRH